MQIDTVILGATGYVGGELLRLVHAHPHFRLCAAVSASRGNEAIATVFPHLGSAYPTECFVPPGSWADRTERGSRLALFSAAPHGASAGLVQAALQAAAARNLDVHVVDSSADFRYADAEAFLKVYGTPHAAPQLLADFSCALPEHAGEAGSRHIGHPGCFATAMLLAAVPLVKAASTKDALFVTGITGSTGSGREPQAGTHHPERHSNLYAYKPLAHRHVPEVEALVKNASGRAVSVRFVPHSGPFARGIYVTLQATLSSAATAAELRTSFAQFYRGAEFVRIVDGTPRLKDVVASNYCHIGIEAQHGSVVVTCAIDNLVKGAAGGAIQWMNRLWSLPETAGLLAAAPAWT